MDNLEFLEHIKKLVIIAMFSDDDLMERLVLKGGNLLDIVYQVSTRASVDVDFSIEGEFDELETFSRRIENTLGQTFAEAGYEAFDIRIREVPSPLSDDMRSFWGGYRVEFKIIERERYEQLKHDLDALRKQAASVGKRGSTKFSVQISKHEYCRPKQPRQLEGYTVYVYSPEMTVSEKLRAVCQQMPEYVATVKSHPSARARDFVDIHTIAEHFTIDFRNEELQRIVREMFAAKRVPLNLIGDIKDFRDYHRQDFTAVEDTLKPGVQLGDFDFYFNYVLAKCRDLETLWNE
jgi:hypothetical protein